MEEKDERDIAGYRRLTFAGVTVAAVATITSIVVVPILFSQAQTIQSQLDVELRFCVMSTHNLFDELGKVEIITGHQSRVKRGARRGVIRRGTGGGYGPGGGGYGPGGGGYGPGGGGGGYGPSGDHQDHLARTECLVMMALQGLTVPQVQMQQRQEEEEWQHLALTAHLARQVQLVDLDQR
ncbi:nematode cuticle collagen domain protein [Ancylostoma duodenale]|uniref:Nematode cuticle collagen domain protein n=1 Tax=Ancylostoma duodenale TaxID=51022 RepID=A0A0C2H560_9BILA|nr:nematode cuticle collagen domain protein [Ancylostoma duodenale]